MAAGSFVHLHTASSYSLRYGTAHPELYARRAAEHGMDALALTDRDGLYGAVKHVGACREAGIRPILGADLAMSDRTRVTLLACGGAGWASLCRLVSAMHLEGERGDPVASSELVAAHAEGLVALLGPDSDVGHAIAQRHPDSARARLRRWREALGNSTDAAIEVVHHRAYGDAGRAARALDLAYGEGAPAVLTNAVRYLDRADAQVADVLDAARAVAPLERRRVARSTAEGYLKSGKEMAEIAAEVCGPDRDAARLLLAGTRKLAERCAIDPHGDLGMGVAHLPETSGEPYAALRARCEAGLARRDLACDREARDRLDEELSVIEGQGLPAYFLTVADVADRIRALGIRCAVRGSGAGSLVTHLLGISEVNPLEHGLLMERFLRAGRGGLPDVDLDVESARRLDAYRAILDTYGADRCTCVSMMETYRARGAIREVGGALGLPQHEVDAIAKAFPHVRASQIGAALTELPELRHSGLDQEQLAGTFRLAQRLDGLPRHIALHPCGVVLSDAGMRARTPVERSYLGFPMSQFDKDDVEEMGLLKLDVLGVRMQSAIAHALGEVRRLGEATESEPVDIDAVPRDDPRTYELIRSTRTLGCFQIESPGQRELVGKLEPASIGDLILDISLFRPGPVSSDMVTPYLRARHGWEAPEHPHPDLASILAETGGVVVFHEQVLRILVTMTGCDLPDAEKARRALDDPLGNEEVRAWFQAAATGRYTGETVERVWEILSSFGAFGFCKAHAAAFALPTYQSAWLKAHHTAAFFAGVLTHEPGMYPKRLLLDDARHFGVPVLGLDVNASGSQWRVERGEGGEHALRVAFAEVKGASSEEVERIVAGRRSRPYRSLPDFWHRAGVSRPVVERIIQVGGLDALYGITGGAQRWPSARVTRRDLLVQVGILDRSGERMPRMGGAPDQLPLDSGGPEEPPPRSGLPEMTDRDRVRAELDILGVDVTRHVLSFYADYLHEIGIVRASDLLRCRSGAEVTVAGVKAATQTPPVRSGQRVIFTTLDDASGPVDVTFFEPVQDECAATVFGSWLLVVRGEVRRTGTRAVSLRATGCWDLTELHQQWRASTSCAPEHRQAPRKLWHASPGSSGG